MPIPFPVHLQRTAFTLMTFLVPQTHRSYSPKPLIVSAAGDCDLNSLTTNSRPRIYVQPSGFRQMLR